jgi:YVTN family beta-propeller protein
MRIGAFQFCLYALALLPAAQLGCGGKQGGGVSPGSVAAIAGSSGPMFDGQSGWGGPSSGAGGATGAAGAPGPTPDPGPTPPLAGSPGTAGIGGPASGGAGPAAGAGGEPAMSPDGLRDVLLVGNGVEGSVSFVDAHSFENLGTVNVIPDRDEVMGLIQRDFARSVAYPALKNAQLLHHFEPSAGDRFVDDVFVSPDGTKLYVSRSNLGDVAAFDLTKPDHPRLWRTFVDGLKADHATMSPDGKRLIVSATTATVADVIDAERGTVTGSFATGDFPHQNDFSADGKHIYNSSIGNVGFEAVSYANNAAKGNRWLVQVDASSLEVTKTWRFDYGIRPNVVTADEKTLYTQLSYLNGVVKYDLVNSREIARSEQPLSAFAMSTYATYDEYPHDSAHHGLALSGDGSKLCDCGTIDNTVSIVNTADMQVLATIEVGMIPYWATNSPDGRYCFVSLSGSDAVSVIDYAAQREVTMIPVGKFPQRSRLGRVPQSVIDQL